MTHPQISNSPLLRSNTEEVRELLLLAAKLAHVKIVGWRLDSDAVSGAVEVALLEDGGFWQPLFENRATDCMGDALRLAMAANIHIEWSRTGKFTVPSQIQASPWGFGHCAVVQLFEESKADALRRAIVLAAGELARESETNSLIGKTYP